MQVGLYATSIADKPHSVIRAFQWDLARQVERLDWLIAQLPRYADWGYQELYLHLEDAVHYPSLPGVGRADAYTYEELATLVAAAKRAGIAVVPIANLLGHTQYLVKVPEWRDLNELRAPDGSPLDRGQLCPLHPRTLELVGKLLHDLAPFCTAGKIHVGCDESFQLGQHPLSQAEIAERGVAAHFAGYVHRLTTLARGLDLRLGLWADMLYYLPEVIPLLPRGVIAYDWYYYPFRQSPRVELFNFAERDLAPALRAQGDRLLGLSDERRFSLRTPAGLRRTSGQYPLMVGTLSAGERRRLSRHVMGGVPPCVGNDDRRRRRRRHVVARARGRQFGRFPGARICPIIRTAAWACPV